MGTDMAFGDENDGQNELDKIEQAMKRWKWHHYDNDELSDCINLEYILGSAVELEQI